jgi:phenylpropionate dioxygenase-like ring-hydroxylating dioxygenase large terminal subunit
VPWLKEAYYGELERERWALQPVAQLDSYKGLFFATFDPEAPPLHEYLGEMTWYLDAFFDRREGGVEVLATHKWVVPCNWKFPAENFGGDAYHVQWSHMSAIKTNFSAGAAAKPETQGSLVSPGNGHVVICFGPNDVADPPLPEILEYEKEIRPEVEKRLGPRSGRVNPIVATAFPNFSMLRATSRIFRVWHPRGPDKTEVWSWVYIDKAAPAHVKKAIRLQGVRGFSPSGSFEQDDMDNWQECTRTCRGVVSRRLSLNTQMGLGHERFREDLNAWASDFRMSESNHRRFYRRWAELMTPASWADLDSRNTPPLA